MCLIFRTETKSNKGKETKQGKAKNEKARKKKAKRKGKKKIKKKRRMYTQRQVCVGSSMVLYTYTRRQVCDRSLYTEASLS